MVVYYIVITFNIFIVKEYMLTILIFILIILIKQHKMSQELDAIKAGVIAAQEKVVKVAADVTLLHAKVDAIIDVPTAEQWAEVQQLTADLNSSLQVIDDQTPEESVV